MMNQLVLEKAAREYHLRQATEQTVLAEVKQVLEFARDYFAMRGKTIVAQNIRCQLEYFSAAEVFQRMDDSDIVPSTNAN
jgi:hypothetical protein